MIQSIFRYCKYAMFLIAILTAVTLITACTPNANNQTIKGNTWYWVTVGGAEDYYLSLITPITFKEDGTATMSSKGVEIAWSSKTDNSEIQKILANTGDVEVPYATSGDDEGFVSITLSESDIVSFYLSGDPGQKIYYREDDSGLWAALLPTKEAAMEEAKRIEGPYMSGR